MGIEPFSQQMVLLWARLLDMPGSLMEVYGSQCRPISRLILPFPSCRFLWKGELSLTKGEVRHYEATVIIFLAKFLNSFIVKDFGSIQLLNSFG